MMLGLYPQQSKLLRALLVFITLNISLVVFAGSGIEIPPLTSPVLDFGEFFTREEKLDLETRVSKLYSAGGPQLQIWTLPSLEGEPIESVSIRAAEAWKLGKGKDQATAGQSADNGLLLTIARKERRYRLEVGQGLEGSIPDVLAGRLLRTHLQPALRQGAPAAGVHSLITEIARISQLDIGPIPKIQSLQKKGSGFRLIPVLFILFLLIRLLGGTNSRSWRGQRHRGWGGFGGGGWSGGGGGGWRGGGGGFSGGGSSGGW